MERKTPSMRTLELMTEPNGTGFTLELFVHILQQMASGKVDLENPLFRRISCCMMLLCNVPIYLTLIPCTVCLYLLCLELSTVSHTVQPKARNKLVYLQTSFDPEHLHMYVTETNTEQDQQHSAFLILFRPMQIFGDDDTMICQSMYVSMISAG